MEDYLNSIVPESNYYYIPTATVLYGTESITEIIAALGLHYLAYQSGGKGPSVIYNFLAGIRFIRKFYPYPYQAALVMAFDTRDLLNQPPKTNVAHAISFALGLMAAKYNLV